MEQRRWWSLAEGGQRSQELEGWAAGDLPQGSLRSPDSKSPAPVSLSHEVSCTAYELKGKVVGNCKMVTTEH